MPPLIFLVEDNPTIREALILTLKEDVGACVAGVSDGENDAVQWLARHREDWSLAVVDLFLKQGSGLGVLRALAADRLPSQKVVMLTNYATPDMRERCLAAGADRVFDKSTELDGFLAYCRSN